MYCKCNVCMHVIVVHPWKNHTKIYPGKIISCRSWHLNFTKADVVYPPVIKHCTGQSPVCRWSSHSNLDLQEISLLAMFDEHTCPGVTSVRFWAEGPQRSTRRPTDPVSFLVYAGQFPTLSILESSTVNPGFTNPRLLSPNWLIIAHQNGTSQFNSLNQPEGLLIRGWHCRSRVWRKMRAG